MIRFTRISLSRIVLPSAVPPGFYQTDSLLSGEDRKELMGNAISLYHQLRERNESNLSDRISHKSVNHNLEVERFYKNISIKDVDSGKTIHGQHFEKYGDEGHQLSYFMGNSNIPQFVSNILIKNVLQTHPLNIPIALVGPPESLQWRFTFNIYSSIQSPPPSFPYHKDIEANGEVTLIYSLGSDAVFDLQSSDEKTVIPFPMIDNSVVLLSGDVRHNWSHRVSLKDKQKPLLPNLSRMSLVLGCHRC